MNYAVVSRTQKIKRTNAERKKLGDKAREYVLSQFSLDNTIDMWHDSLSKLVKDWKEGKRVVKRYETMEF